MPSCSCDIGDTPRCPALLGVPGWPLACPPRTVSLPNPSVSVASVPKVRVAASRPTTDRQQHPPVYCPRNVTAPGGFPRCFRRAGGARGPAGHGSGSEAAAEDREAGGDPRGPSSSPAGCTRAEHCGLRGTTRTWSPRSCSPRTSRCPWGAGRSVSPLSLPREGPTHRGPAPACPGTAMLTSPSAGL